MATTSRKAVTAATALGLAFVLCSPAQGATPRTKRVSVRSNGTQADLGSHDPSTSANGRFVAFESDATNLVGNDDNEHEDVFVYDRETKKTRRVSVRSNGDEADLGSYDPSISANGRFVAFDSDATNLVGNDDNDHNDVFVYDRRTQKTTLVSVRSNGAQGDGDSFAPSLSGDGRLVAFNSEATDLVASDDNTFTDIFVYDRKTKRTKRVSVRSNGNQAEGGSSTEPSISANGRFVAFESHATNLVGNDDNEYEDIFVYDRETQKTTRVSVRSNGAQGDEGSSASSISASGRFVAFESDATNLTGAVNNDSEDVFVHDRRTKKTTLESVRSNGDVGDDDSEEPSISASGRFVAFESDASNFVEDDSGYEDIFVRDRTTKKTKRVSVRSNGDEADAGSYAPSISADGRFVAFESEAINLVGNDDNTYIDIFLRGPLN